MTEIFNLLIVYFHKHSFLFVLNEQVKEEVQKQPFKCVPREKIKKVGKILQNQL